MKARCLLLLSLAACSETVTVEEPMMAAEIRIIAVLGEKAASAVARGGSETYRADVEPIDGTEQVWVLAYTKGDLVARFPSLAEKSTEEIAAAIDPRFDDPDGVEPPEARDVRRSALTSPLAFHGATWGEWVEASKMRLRLHFTSAPPGCSAIRWEEVLLPTGTQVRDAVALDDDTILAIDNAAIGDPSGRTPFTRIDGFTITNFTIPNGPRGIPLAMVHDYAGYAYVVTSYLDPLGGPTLFRVDREGGLHPAPGLRLAEPGGLFSADDGTLLAKQGHDLYQFMRGETSTTALPSFPGELVKVGYAGRNRTVAWNRDSLWLLSGVWRMEHTFNFGAQEVFVLGGDSNAIVSGGVYESVLLRNEDRASWSSLPAPFGQGHQIRSIEGVGGGRFAVGGDMNALAIWMGTDWCVVRVDNVGTAFLDLSVSPSKRTLIAVGVTDPNTPGGRHALIRVRLP